MNKFFGQTFVFVERGESINAVFLVTAGMGNSGKRWPFAVETDGKSWFQPGETIRAKISEKLTAANTALGKKEIEKGKHILN